MRLAYAFKVLHFREPAGTSRGVLREKPTFFIKVWDEANPDVYGLGEAAVFPGLSPEAGPQFGTKMVELLANVALGRATDLDGFSSIRFGLEQALLDLAGGGRRIYVPSDFTEGNVSVDINGLIWMGNRDEMMRRLEAKLEAGFRCIKIKIGAIRFDEELELLHAVRDAYPASVVELRVDANGAFSPEEVMERLDALAQFDLHSIEQPVRPGQPDVLARVCRESPVPVALDEELIGIDSDDDRVRLLDTAAPAFVVLKPVLCGGFSGAQAWMDAAAERGVGYWVTSALESNIGLNALAQWTAARHPSMPQGLGTGALYTDNFTTPLRLDGERMTFDPAVRTPEAEIDALDWRM